MNLLSFVILCASATSVAETTDELLKAANMAMQQGRSAAAIDLVNQAITGDPKSVAVWSMRAAIFDAIDKYDKSLADWSKVLELDKKSAAGYQQRGLVHFKLGKVAESIADFDKFIELKPNEKGSHWQRGISYYYAGRYADGSKQFEGYQDHDKNDVENAVWRFMCVARADGIDKARQSILKVGFDRRVPMRQIYDLYKGTLKPDDVLAEAKAGDVDAAQRNFQLFYAHLYVGIYHDLAGDKKKAFEHINQAAEKHRLGHYMWDVARVHRDVLAKELKR